MSSCARFLTGAKSRCSTRPLFIKLHWLPLEARILFKLAVFGYKILHQSSPIYFSDRIFKLLPVKETRSASAPVLTSECCRSTSRLVKYSDRSGFYSICKTFNSLPADVRASTNLSTFKQRLKKYLFITSFTA